MTVKMTAHIAAKAVCISDVHIQRCACCGKLLKRVVYTPEQNPLDETACRPPGMTVITTEEDGKLTPVAYYPLPNGMLDNFVDGASILDIVDTDEFPPLEGVDWCWDVGGLN